MNDVKRYRPCKEYGLYPGLAEDSDGPWVSYEDYAALLKHHDDDMQAWASLAAYALNHWGHALGNGRRLADVFIERMDAALKVLKDVEWRGTNNEEVEICPDCGFVNSGLGHQSTCALATAIGAPRRPVKGDEVEPK